MTDLSFFAKWSDASREAALEARRAKMQHHLDKADKHERQAADEKDPHRRALLMMSAKSHRDAAAAFRNGNDESGNLHAAVAHHLMHSKKRAPASAEHTLHVEYDGDFDMGGLVGHLERLGAIGASREVHAMDENEKPVRFGWDGDGADKIRSAKLDGKDITKASYGTRSSLGRTAPGAHLFVPQTSDNDSRKEMLVRAAGTRGDPRNKPDNAVSKMEGNKMKPKLDEGRQPAPFALHKDWSDAARAASAAVRARLKALRARVQTLARGNSNFNQAAFEERALNSMGGRDDTRGLPNSIGEYMSQNKDIDRYPEPHKEVEVDKPTKAETRTAHSHGRGPTRGVIAPQQTLDWYQQGLSRG